MFKLLFIVFTTIIFCNLHKFYDRLDIIVTIAHYLSAIITGMSEVDIASDLLINLQGVNEDEFYHIEGLLGEVYGEEI